MTHRGICIAAVLTLLAVACGPAATPAPTPPAVPTATLSPGEKPAPTPTPRPTPTPTRSAVLASPRYGGVLRARQDNRSPRSFDRWAVKTGARDVSSVANLNFSQLFVYPPIPETNCQLVLTPELAESWKWLREDVLEVKIHQGVKFHNKPPVNGRELTAEDVAWSARQFLLDNTLYQMEQIAPHVTKIEATDRYTVRFTTDGPLPILLTEGLTSYYGALILPKEAVEPNGSWGNPEKSYIGSGPFTFEAYRPGVSVDFVRNDNYFKKGMPYLDRVHYAIIPDVSTQAAALRSGALDIIPGQLPGPIATPLRQRPGIDVYSCLQISAHPARFYYRIDRPPFNDVRVRRAMSMALDREGMVKTILQGEGVAVPLLAPQVLNHHVGFDELPPAVRQWVTYSPDRARQLLAEAGYSKGFQATMLMSSNYATDPFLPLVEAVIAHWSDVGIKVKLNLTEHARWAYFAETGDFRDNDMGVGTASAGSIPQTVVWHSKDPPTANRNRINDPEVDRLIEAYTRELDLNKAQQIFKQLETRIIDQVYDLTPGAHPQEFAAARDYVKGFRGINLYYPSIQYERIWLAK